MTNYRGLGLAEMARAIAEGREHRASGVLGHHLLAVMTAILEAAETGRASSVIDPSDRPAALDEVEAWLCSGGMTTAYAASATA